MRRSRNSCGSSDDASQMMACIMSINVRKKSGSCNGNLQTSFELVVDDVIAEVAAIRTIFGSKLKL